MFCFFLKNSNNGNVTLKKERSRGSHKECVQFSFGKETNVLSCISSLQSHLLSYLYISNRSFKPTFKHDSKLKLSL